MSDRLLIDSQQFVASLDTSFVGRAARIDARCDDASVLLDPPGAVIRNWKLSLFLEIDDRKHYGRCRKNGQNYRRKPD